MRIQHACYSGTGFEPTTITELIQWRACHFPHERAFSFLSDGGTSAPQVTFGELDRNAKRIAGWLQSRGLGGERALLIYPPGMDYIFAVLGCLYAGVTAVPAYPPDPTRLSRTLPRLHAIARDAQAAAILTTGSVLAMMKMVNIGRRVVRNAQKIPFWGRLGRSLSSRLSAGAATPETEDLAALKWLSTEGLDDGFAQGWRQPPLTGDTIAFVQYTSGSTREPRGVLLSHENLLHNLALIHRAMEIRTEHEAVFWLPMYHDMGLIGGVLGPLYEGIPCTLFSPLIFLRRPLLWLQTISRIKDRPVISGGPNFAYDLCVRKISAQQQSQLDLSRWELAFCGAEPVRPQTIERFSEVFGSCGFRKNAFYPCYGLAEAALIVSGGRAQDPPVFCALIKEAIARNKAVETDPKDNQAQVLVGCGRALMDERIVIVEPQSLRRCFPGEVGEIWVSSPSVAQGFLGRPEETEQVFRARLADTGEGPFLRTGDLGFLRNGELFITGRIKDLIVVRGRNHYPQDIELTVENSHPSLRRGCGAAFSIDLSGEERLVVAQEVQTDRGLKTKEIIVAVRQAVAEAHGVQIHAVSLLKPRSIPKTSSGKIRRSACKAMFLAGTLEMVETKVFEETLGPVTEASGAPSLLARALLSMDPQGRQTLLEAHVMDVLGRTLNVQPSQMDRDLPLAVLGVDSVAAVDLLSALEGSLGVALEMESLYRDVTISQVAALLLDRLAPAKPLTRLGPREVSVRAKAAPEEYPLSFGQRALWYLQQLDPASVAHNVVHALQLRPDTDMAALKRGLQRLIDRHPVLRTTFHERQGDPLQRVHPQAEICFAVHEAADWSDGVLEEHLAGEIYRPFNLATGPLFRVDVFRRPPHNPVMLVALHHIVTDLWSLMIMLAELTKHYDEFTRGIPANLKPLRAAYSDYVAHQAETLKGPEGERLWRFWREHLAGPLPPLKLPTDRPRPPAPTDKGAALHWACSVSLTSSLEHLARSRKTSLFTVVLAAFQLLLHRYTGQEQIQVGTPKAGRTHKMARVLGYFINPVVLKAKIDESLTFSGFLDQVHAEVERVSEHDTFPFPLLVERLAPTREQSHTPIFQVMLAWQKTTSAVEQSATASIALGDEKQRAEVGNLVVGPVFLKQRATPFDWALWVTEAVIEGKKQLRCMLEYRMALFDEETIRRVLNNFETLLEGVSQNPDGRLTGLPLIHMHERHQIRQWSVAPPSSAGIASLLPTLFEDRVLNSPDAIALSQSTQQLTYSELNSRANQLAHHLQRLGVRAEKRVALCVERSCAAMVGLIAVWKAGGVYLPLDPASPEERLGFMLHDAEPEVVLTQCAFKERFRAASATVLLLDADEEEPARQSSDNPVPSVHPENAAYIIYTSGTTGKPKAVLVSHGEFARHCLQVAEHYLLTPADRVLQFAALNFDASLEQIVPTLISGATVELMGRHIWAPMDFQTRVNEVGISVANLPPAYFQQVAQEWNPDLETQNGRLRLIIIGGDALPPASLDLWRQRCQSPVKLLNAYGPTEATVTATTHAAGPSTEAQRTPIGRPLPGRSAVILDRSGNLAPIGVMGELHLGGAGLARGYLGRPDRTAESFIPDAFGPDAGVRLYRTGDLARYRPDGCIEVMGGGAHQVKIRGFRIELGEIEAALTRHPDIREAVVDVHEDAAGDRQLAAYVVGRRAGAPTRAELRVHLKRHLPDYMIPVVFVRLDTLPMASSGKVDRKSLPPAVAAPREPFDDYAGPRTTTEAELAGMWAEVLGMERVGIHDNFFDLGGHSLKATQLVSRIRAAFSVELSLRSLFDAPTVAGVATLVEDRLIAEAGDEELSRLLAEMEGTAGEDVQPQTPGNLDARDRA